MERITSQSLNASVMQRETLNAESVKRRNLIEQSFLRMSLSAQREPIDPDHLDLLVEDAIRLWKEIPTAKIAEAVDEGIIEAGNFPCTAGLVAKCWREGTKKELHLGDGCRMSLKDTQNYIAMMNDPQRILGLHRDAIEE